MAADFMDALRRIAAGTSGGITAETAQAALDEIERAHREIEGVRHELAHTADENDDLRATLAMRTRQLREAEAVPPGPCPSDAPQPVSCTGMPLLRCELRAGHTGDHENGTTRWWGPEADPTADQPQHWDT